MTRRRKPHLTLCPLVKLSLWPNFRDEVNARNSRKSLGMGPPLLAF
jgi:hypothetical protein